MCNGTMCGGSIVGSGFDRASCSMLVLSRVVDLQSLANMSDKPIDAGMLLNIVQNSFYLLRAIVVVSTGDALLHTACRGCFLDFIDRSSSVHSFLFLYLM